MGISNTDPRTLCSEGKQKSTQNAGKRSSTCNSCSGCYYQSHCFPCQHNPQHHHYHHYHHSEDWKTRAFCPSRRRHRTLLHLTACTVLLVLILPVSEAQDQVTLGPLKEEQPSNYYVGSIASATGISRELTNSAFKKLQFIINDDTPLFSINAHSGAIFTKQMIDREEICGDRLECVKEFDVTVKSENKFYRMVEVRVNITDINDNPPKFHGEGEIIVDIPENNEPGFSKLLPVASDPDIGLNSVQEYFLLPSDAPFSLHVDRRLDNRFVVSLRVDSSLDREKRELYTLRVAARDGGPQPYTGTLTVHVNVTDKNDNEPKFTQPSYTFTVQETFGTGKVVGKLTATDKDTGRNADIRYSMIFAKRYERGKDLFAIDQFTGEITIISPLQFDAGKTFHAVVEAQDRGDPPGIAEAEMTITVVNVGNNPPVLDVKLTTTKFSNTVTVSEDASNKTYIGKLKVIDNDPGSSGNVTCRSLHPNFTLEDFGYYAIFMNGSLDREAQSSIDVTITCSDQGTPPMSASVLFKVMVLDVNDNAPKFNQTVYNVNVVEENIVGKQIFKISAHDPDDHGHNEFTYSLFPKENRVFSIDEHSGIIKARTTFDHEIEKRLNVIVLATDTNKPSLVGTATVVVNILDINDNYPELLTKELRVPEGGGRMKVVGRLRATDKDSGRNAQLVFSLPLSGDPMVSQMFRVDTDGTVVALQELDREKTDRYNLRVEVRDNGEPSKTHTATVVVIVEDINDNEPVFLYPSVHNPPINIPWSTPADKELVKLNATDDDAGENKTITYQIISGNSAKIFSLDANTGSLYMSRRVYPDDPQIYELMIAARDRGIQPQESVVFLKLTVDATNASAAWLESEFELPPLEEEIRKAKQERYILIAGVVAGVTLLFSIIIIVVIILIRNGGTSARRRRQQAPVALNDKPPQWHVVKMSVQEEGGKGGGETGKVVAWRGSDVDIDLKGGGDGMGGGADRSSYCQPDVTKTGNDTTLKKTVASSHWHDGKDDPLQGQSSSNIGIGLDPYRKQDFYTFCKVSYLNVLFLVFSSCKFVSLCYNQPRNNLDGHNWNDLSTIK
ncbi:cadherin-related protein [Elysia marginata]|uniref:Cadherin-related protein n=1 Tax=Elysia marginata TaxID=1093978 RepID=A0AAV4FGC0_9GAST|nr:cadherin-related protein [Elysia marginata]